MPASAFREHVFGVVLVNDWSARDIQAWEYVPLGPFLGKSFATSISAWVTPLALLEDRRVAAPVQEPEPLPHLRVEGDWAFDLPLEVELNGTVISRGNARGLYWTMPQQLAHATSNGASIRTGDLMASGTISGARARQRGQPDRADGNGTEPVRVGDGTRTFLEDGDEVVLRGEPLGEVRGRIESPRVGRRAAPPADARHRFPKVLPNRIRNSWVRTASCEASASVLPHSSGTSPGEIVRQHSPAGLPVIARPGFCRYDDDEPGSPWTITPPRRRHLLPTLSAGRARRHPPRPDAAVPRCWGLPWNRKPSIVRGVSASRIELDHVSERRFLRVADRVVLRVSRPVETDQTVTCVIPGHHEPGIELYADLLHVSDEPYEDEFIGNCAFSSSFAYSSDD